jgi:hypothetical protein
LGGEKDASVPKSLFFAKPQNKCVPITQRPPDPNPQHTRDMHAHTSEPNTNSSITTTKERENERKQEKGVPLLLVTAATRCLLASLLAFLSLLPFSPTPTGLWPMRWPDLLLRWRSIEGRIRIDPIERDRGGSVGRQTQTIHIHAECSMLALHASKQRSHQPSRRPRLLFVLPPPDKIIHAASVLHGFQGGSRAPHSIGLFVATGTAKLRLPQGQPARPGGSVGSHLIIVLAATCCCFCCLAPHQYNPQG